ERPAPESRPLLLARWPCRRHRPKGQLWPDVIDGRAHRVVSGDDSRRDRADRNRRVRDAEDGTVSADLELHPSAEDREAVNGLIEYQVGYGLAAASVLARLEQRCEILRLETEQVVVAREEAAGDLFWSALSRRGQRPAVCENGTEAGSVPVRARLEA